MLDQLINSQKDNNARLASIEKSINQLVVVNKKQAAEERMRNRREAAFARRQKSARSPGGAIKADAARNAAVDAAGSAVPAKAAPISDTYDLSNAPAPQQAPQNKDQNMAQTMADVFKKTRKFTNTTASQYFEHAGNITQTTQISRSKL